MPGKLKILNWPIKEEAKKRHDTFQDSKRAWKQHSIPKVCSSPGSPVPAPVQWPKVTRACILVGGGGGTAAASTASQPARWGEEEDSRSRQWWRLRGGCPAHHWVRHPSAASSCASFLRAASAGLLESCPLLDGPHQCPASRHCGLHRPNWFTSDFIAFCRHWIFHPFTWFILCLRDSWRYSKNHLTLVPQGPWPYSLPEGNYFQRDLSSERFCATSKRVYIFLLTVYMYPGTLFCPWIFSLKVFSQRWHCTQSVVHAAWCVMLFCMCVCP